MRDSAWILGVALALAAGCKPFSSSEGMETEVSGADSPAPAATGEDGEANIALDQVPEVVKAAARAAVPGIALEEAEFETENGAAIYDLEGIADGEEYEVEVAADGTVIEVERESASGEDDADDEGDDDGDDDDDDDDGEDDGEDDD